MNNIETTLADRILGLIHRTGHTSLLRVDQALDDVGLSHAKMWALLPLIHAGQPLGVTQLAACMPSGKSNVTQLVDRLEAEGLVQRTRNPDDRRSVLIELTADGQRRAEASLAIRQQVAEQIVAALSEEEQSQLLTLMERIVASFDTT